MHLFSMPERFWSEITEVDESATPYILRRTVVFGLIALVVTLIEKMPNFPTVGIDVTPYEVLGVAMGALLVLRTNAGYERWWEGRKLWGGIVNQCRNLVIQALSYGPDDPEWRREIVCWTAAFAHVTRRSLRSERVTTELESLIGTVRAHRIASVDHMPGSVSMKISQLLEAGAEMGMDRFAFMKAEEERVRLIDHLGGCERILKTPLPMAYSIEIRRFIFVFLAALPFGILWKVSWLTPFVTMLVAFPILALDEIGVELQDPFSRKRLNHLPLDKICSDIERNLLALLEERNSQSALSGYEAVSASDDEVAAGHGGTQS